MYCLSGWTDRQGVIFREWCAGLNLVLSRISSNAIEDELENDEKDVIADVPHEIPEGDCFVRRRVIVFGEEFDLNVFPEFIGQINVHVDVVFSFLLNVSWREYSSEHRLEERHYERHEVRGVRELWCVAQQCHQQWNKPEMVCACE